MNYKRPKTIAQYPRDTGQTNKNASLFFVFSFLRIPLPLPRKGMRAAKIGQAKGARGYSIASHSGALS